MYTPSKGDQAASRRVSDGTAPTDWRTFAIAAGAVQLGLTALGVLGVKSHPCHPYLLIGCAVAALASSLGLYGAHARRRWLVAPAALLWGLFVLLVVGFCVYALVATCLTYQCDRDDDPSGCRSERNRTITLFGLLALLVALIPGPLVYVQVRYLFATTHDTEDGFQPMELKSVPMTA